MNCETYHAGVNSLLSEPLTREKLDQLQEHWRSCDKCRNVTEEKAKKAIKMLASTGGFLETIRGLPMPPIWLAIGVNMPEQMVSVLSASMASSDDAIEKAKAKQFSGVTFAVKVQSKTLPDDVAMALAENGIVGTDCRDAAVAVMELIEELVKKGVKSAVGQLSVDTVSRV